MRTAAYLLGLGLATLTLMSPAAAFADQLGCGAIVTQSVVVDADLLECTGDGLVASAPGITIDLNGHRVDGTESGAGIRISAPDVTVRLGSISDFATAVLLDSEALAVGGAGDVWLADLVVESNGLGIGTVGLFPATSLETLTVVSSRIRDNVTGIRTFAAGGTVIIGDSVLKRNREATSIYSSTAAISDSEIIGNRFGVQLQFASGSTVLRNEFRGNEFGGFAAQRSYGTLLSSNRITENGSAGAVMDDSPGSIVRRNIIKGNQTGLALYESIAAYRQDYFVGDNTIRFNSGYGVMADNPGFPNGGGNVIKNNNGGGNAPQCLNFPC